MSCGIIILFASRYSVKLRQKLDRLNQLFLESLEGVRVIRAFNKQQAERRRFGEANTDYAATAMLSGRITSLLLPVINVIFGVTTAAEPVMSKQVLWRSVLWWRIASISVWY